MAVPKPGIETTRSEQAPEARAASTISTATTKGYRPGWAKPRLHVTSHHGYLEEDTSDEELMEHDDEADMAGDLCHTGCEVSYNRFPFRRLESDRFYSQCSSHFLRQLTRPLRPSFPTTLALL